MRGLSCDRSHAARAERSFAGNLPIALCISVIVLTPALSQASCARAIVPPSRVRGLRRGGQTVAAVWSRSMYSVELDRSKRLLVISAVQRVTAEQARQAAQQVRELLENVGPGFRVLADFRWLDAMDAVAAGHVAQIMDALAEKQVASVTRVMPDPHKDIGLNILSQFHYGPEIQITTFETLADAVQSLVKEGGGTSEEMATHDQ